MTKVLPVVTFRRDASPRPSARSRNAEPHRPMKISVLELPLPASGAGNHSTDASLEQPHSDQPPLIAHSSRTLTTC